MRIRMKTTIAGSVDRATTALFSAGQEYDLGASEGARDLAEVFLREGWAEVAAAPKPAPEARQIPAAPENRAMPAPQNKGGRR